MKKENLKEKGWGFYIMILIIIGLLCMFFSLIISGLAGDGINSPSGNIALIPIKGIIVGDAQKGLISSQSAASSDIIEMIETAAKDDAIKGIILEIDSPGGMVVPTDEIGQAISKVNKTTVAWIRSTGASGGYWIATNTDMIFANKMSVVGSIGVISSYLQFSGLLDDYNVTYERIVSGKYKDMGSPYKNLTFEEREIFQTLIDKIRVYFIQEVAENRNLDKSMVEELATGQVFLGYEALELGLIDRIGGKDEVHTYMKKKLNLDDIRIAEYRTEKTFFEMLSSVYSDNSFYVGKGIGAGIIEKSQQPSYPMVWS